MAEARIHVSATGIDTINRLIEETRQRLATFGYDVVESGGKPGLRRRGTAAAPTPAASTPAQWVALPGGGIQRVGYSGGLPPPITMMGTAGGAVVPPGMPSAGGGAAPPTRPTAPPTSAAGGGPPAPGGPGGGSSGGAPPPTSPPGPPPSGGGFTPPGGGPPTGPGTPPGGGNPFGATTGGVNAYQAALSRVDARARGLFDTLQQLGRRYRQQGFLGEEDQRTVRKTEEQWQRATRMVELQRQGALGSLQNAPTPNFWTSGTQAQAMLRQRNRLAGTVLMLGERRRAMDTLHMMAGVPAVPPEAEEEEEQGPSLYQRGRARVRGWARQAGALAAGVGVYQTLTHAMSLYEQRAQGVIHVGMLLEGEFSRVRSSIDEVRNEYQVLARDSIPAMTTFARSAGDLTGFGAAMRTGRAYGMDLTAAGGYAGQLQRLTHAGPNPLATAVLARTGFPAGMTGMLPETLIPEIVGMAGVGGTAAAQVPLDFYSRLGGVIGGMGERYQLPGGISGFYERFAHGAQNAPDEAVQAMRFRALQRLQLQKGNLLTVGRGPNAERLDLSQYWDQLKALELAPQSPEILQAYQEEARIVAGGRAELEPMAYHSIVTGRALGAVESDRLMKGMGKAGGFQSLKRPLTGALATQENWIAQRIADMTGQPEFRPQEAAVAAEKGLTEVGRIFVNASTDMQKAVAKLAEAAELGTGSMGKLKDALASLDGPTQGLIGLLTVLGSSGNTAQGLGWLLMGSGLVTSTGTRGWNLFHDRDETMEEAIRDMSNPRLNAYRHRP